MDVAAALHSVVCPISLHPLLHDLCFSLPPLLPPHPSPQDLDSDGEYRPGAQVEEEEENDGDLPEDWTDERALKPKPKDSRKPQPIFRSMFGTFKDYTPAVERA